MIDLDGDTQVEDAVPHGMYRAVIEFVPLTDDEAEVADREWDAILAKKGTP
jgi:hypothetical protein